MGIRRPPRSLGHPLSVWTSPEWFHPDFPPAENGHSARDDLVPARDFRYEPVDRRRRTTFGSMAAGAPVLADVQHSVRIAHSPGTNELPSSHGKGRSPLRRGQRVAAQARMGKSPQMVLFDSAMKRGGIRKGPATAVDGAAAGGEADSGDGRRPTKMLLFHGHAPAPAADEFHGLKFILANMLGFGVRLATKTALGLVVAGIAQMSRGFGDRAAILTRICHYKGSFPCWISSTGGDFAAGLPSRSLLRSRQWHG